MTSIHEDCAQARLSTRFAIQFLTLCLFLFLARGAWGQANAGITGTVTDSSGAVIPDANVTITNEGTSVSNKTTTSSVGTYSVTGLTPGAYTVAVEKGGFKKAVQNHVNVEVSLTSTINFTMTSGAATETVEVEASSIALNTTAPQLGSTIEPVVVKSLPAEVAGRGRQIDSLQFLAPGVNGSTFSHRISGGVDFEQEIVYNGIPAPQPETEGYTTNFNPPYEMVQEFRVERSTFSAQFGLGQGALTYQMASGTNNYHGDLFEINRNSFFDSVGFFNSPYWGNGKVPTDHENNYGFTVGGPISIPKLYNGKDRTFGHYSQEWYKQNSESTDSNTVPTALQKTGNFSDFVDASGNIIPIYDPLTGQPFPGNIIPAARISPNSASLLKYIPDPNRPGLDSNRTFAPFINPHIQHVWGFTVDQKLTDRQSIHYSQWRNSFSNYSFDGTPARDFVIAPNPLNSQKFEPALGSGFLLSYNNTLTPSLVMTAGFGWIGEINNQFNQNKFSFPAVQAGIIPPNITFDGQHPTVNFGSDGSWLQSINRKLGIAIVNNYLWTHGRNTFNIGWEFRRSYQDDNEEQTAGGRFQFSQRTTSTPNPNDPNFGSYGSSFASFLLGLPDSANRSNSQELKLRNLAFSPYIQDDIKITPKLTVNLGLRWDIQVPFTEVNNNVVFFNPNVANPGAGGLQGAATKLGNCAGCAGYNRADIHWGHIGPRIGFAYQLNNKTVLQAGFAIAFLNGGAYEYGTNKVAVNYGNLLVGSFTRGSSNSATSSYGSWDTNLLPNPAPAAFSPTLGIATQINDFSKNDGYAPYSQQWNLNVQRELPYNTFVTAAWVGNRVIHLPSQLNVPNQLDPKYFAQYGNVISQCPANIAANVKQSVLSDTFASNCAQFDGFTTPYANFAADFAGSSTVAQSLTPYPQYSYIYNNFEASGTTYYQGLQLQVEKRFTDGLSFLAGYTLSRLWDNTSSGFGSFTAAALNKYNQKPEWAVSGSDEPNTFKMSGTYELPIGPGKKYFTNKGVTGQLLGGWQVGWILDYEAGQAFGVTESGNPYPGQSTSGPNVSLRPDRNAGVKLSTANYGDIKKTLRTNAITAPVFNAKAFTATPTQYVLGNSIRNYGELRNPAQYNENANVRKHFYFGERFQGILQVDYFNLFNRTMLNGPDTNISNTSTFGTITNKNANNSNGPNNRQGQVSFRLEF